MSSITFDTLKYAQRLKEAGVPSNQAEAEALALSEAMSEVIEWRDLATKADLEAAKVDIIKWVAALLVAQAGLVAALVKLL